MNDSPSASSSDAKKPRLNLAVLPETLAICRLGPKAWLPRWVYRSSFYAVAKTNDELSIVCQQHLIPADLACERDWRAFRVVGTLDFALVGVLAALSLPLAKARISIFGVSTFDTDYLLVRAKNLERAITVLESAGHRFVELPEAPAEPVEAAAVVAPEPDAEVNTTGTRVAVPAVPAVVPEPEAKAVEPPAATELPTRAIFPVLLEDAVARAPWWDASAKTQATAEPVERTPFPWLQKRPVPVVAEPVPLSEEPAPLIAELAPAVEIPEPPKLEAQPEIPPQEANKPATVALETLPADERVEILDEAEIDDEVDTTGMFTGAIPQHPVETVEDTFESLGISAAIRETLIGIGFQHPTPIQAGVIPLALEGLDIIGLAETGSGKTAAFCLPLAEKLTHGRGLRGLILCPTREIALQTKAFLEIFGRDHELRTALVIGGVKMGPQIDALRRQPDIVVATPGRLTDHARRGNLRLDKIEELVLDEADHMLDLGFLPQIQEILEQLPEKHRTLMFSATMPPQIERLAQRFMRDPYQVDLRPVGATAAGIEHRLYLVREDDKKQCLVELLKKTPGSTLIFTRRKLHAEWLARHLEMAGLELDRIHSDRSQGQRVQALRGFREGRFRILVATDVAARGIDVPRLQHVINFGVPETVDDYVHRAGRTARGNAVGIVSTIATWLDKAAINDIERTLGLEIPRHEAPGIEAYKEIKRRPTVRRRRLL